ncbi:DUF1513 domain-containing protein [Roseicyclus sp. F158]|uniref:DUF1513 domain-containing protein n=1 Tax=Tropicimonas omnivorans TaxID=3075590 RepID=A0ABU3DBZ5_9RHOB|nr:DUF1513 domain-containing protein [Roseicyclus sp. F158]MDT0681230.1 DUF1513 domain-containing protein [Roseicyclus sp. F158]
MTTRRTFMASLLAAAAAPKLTWAEAGNPAYLGAAREADGGFALFGLSADGADLFRISLPGRGHAAAAHPVRPEAVAFARRPGTFALVIDCARGRLAARLEAPEGRHFYGHGAFLHGGEVLATTENHIESGEGRIGFWAASEGYARIGEVASGGIGPHEVRTMPDGRTLAVANGGILTRPETGRDKLNIPQMAPNLAYAGEDGVLETVSLDPDLHLDSIRHLAVSAEGRVAFAMQWQGEAMDGVPLLGLHFRGEAPQLLEAGFAEQVAMEGYAGSVAISGERVAITSPRGGRVHVFGLNGELAGILRRSDVCGIAPAPAGFVASDGLGGLLSLDTAAAVRPLAHAARSWDNHLVALG